MIQVTLGEGNTPVTESVRVGPELGLQRLLFKLENCNPSGSYKDRFVAAEVGRMLRDGARVCVATSSGNTGASLAAYCARYEIACAIVVNDRAPAGKLEQMRAHGARIFQVKDFITSPSVTARVFEILSVLSRERGIPLVVSAYCICPEGMLGVELIAHELVEQASEGINDIFVPVGGGGLFTAVCRGFKSQSLFSPRIHAVQLAGCSTVVAAFERGDIEIRPVESTTRISGLAVPFDLDASAALAHLRESGGVGIAVSDEEVFTAQRDMLVREGIYCEPAGAAALAGLRVAVRKGLINMNSTVFCLVTGHGFKDPDSVREVAAQFVPARISHEELAEHLQGVVVSCA